jgi:hypothetical protein
MQWAEPDVAHAAEGIAWVHRNRTAAVSRATSAAREICEKYSVERIGALAKVRLMELLARNNPEKLAAVQHGEHERHRPQTLPIPGDWYDADYFENGLKSNWDRGYTWSVFKNVFEDAAAYLTEMFPESHSMLDAGCAKGFLVRAVRARGKEAWGFDHSQWAISRADQAAKAFISLEDAARVNYDRQFDLLIALSLLESLTERQIDSFVARARSWTRHALIATIPTLAEGRSYDRSKDSDLSHITMHERRWWQERFLAAGWRQDALHRIVERRCQQHPLPMRMGWQVYVFAP